MTFPPYTYPDSSVLINRFDLRDAETLEMIERKLTYTQLGLLSSQVVGVFDIAHLKRIHYRLFHELYDWAGEFRLVDIGKGQTLFCRVAFLDSEADRIRRWLEPRAFRPMPHVVPMAQLAGELLTHLNMLHPFREGNGRTQREFVRQLARFHGFCLDYDRMDAERYMTASITDNPQEMAEALRAAMVNSLPDRALRAQHQASVEPDWER